MTISPQLSKYASELGRRGGLKGGRARAQKLPPQRRQEIARAAANARWHKVSKPKRPEEHFLAAEDLEAELDAMLRMRRDLDRSIDSIRYVLEEGLKPAD